MAEVAASGGYYVASGADAIVAEPATFTGSIGIYFLRASFSGLYEKLEIGTEVIARGPLAGITGSDRPLTPLQRQRTSDWIGSLYAEFLERVAEGRGMDAQDVDKLGQGPPLAGRHRVRKRSRR